MRRSRPNGRARRPGSALCLRDSSGGEIPLRVPAAVRAGTVSAAKFAEGRRTERLQRVFLTEHPENAENVGMLEPLDSRQPLLADEPRGVEAATPTALAKRTRG